MENDFTELDEYEINDFRRFQTLSKQVDGILGSIIKNLMVGVYIFQVHDGKRMEALYLSDEYFNVIGYEMNQYKRHLRDLTAGIVKEDEEKIYENIELSLKNNCKFDLACRGKRGNGEMAWFHMMGMPIDLGTEEPCFLAFINDITSVMTEYESLKKLKSIKDELLIEKQRYRILEETTPALLFEYIPKDDNMIFSYNFPDNHERKIVHGYLNFLEKTPLVHKSHIGKFKAALQRACEVPTKDKIEYLSEVSSGGYQWHRTIYASVLDKDGNIISVMGRIYNVNNEILEREKQERMAQIDNLTGAYLKNIGYARMEKLMKEEETKNLRTFLVMMDLDNFKEINDTKGHSAGDYVLKRFSQKAIELVDEVGFVTRFGGDEFLIFVQGIEEAELQKKLEELHQYATEIPGYEGTNIDFSEGIVHWNNMTLSQAFEEADRQMYAVKRRKKQAVASDRL